MSERVNYTLEDAKVMVDKKGKGELIAIAHYPSPKDYFLFLVLIEIRTGEFAVWTYNAQVNGMSDGDYATTQSPNENRGNAFRYFASRLERYAKLMLQ